MACSHLVGRIFKWHDDDPVIRLVVVKFCGLMGFFLAGMHAFFSFCLLDPAYFAKYFDLDGRLNIVGEVGMALGVLAMFALMAPAITTLPMMPMGLPPISLLAVIADLVPFGFKYKSTRS